MNNMSVRGFGSSRVIGVGRRAAGVTATVFFAIISGWLSTAQAQPIEPTYSDVVYAVVDGQPLHLDLYLPDGAGEPTPLVVWIHGGGWCAGDKYPSNTATAALLDNGLAVASVNYRLTSDTSFPNRIFPAQIHDVKGAVRFLRAQAAMYSLDPGRIGAWGGSAGGHLAALLGTSGGLADLEGDVGGNLAFSSLAQAICDCCGPANLWNMYPQDDEPDSPPSLLIGHALGDIKANIDNPNPPYPELVARMNAASPIAHVTPDDPPFFIAHGDEDDVVPPWQSADLAAALASANVPVSYHPMPGVGHGGTPEVDELAVEFFVATLGDGNQVYQPRGVHDVDLLDSGNLLVTDGGTLSEPTTGGIYEIDRDGNILWSYTSGLNWAHNADKQPNGTVIISDTGNDRVIIVDQAGTIIWNSDAVVLSDGSTLHYPNDANLLGNGNLLITDRDNHRVIEIDVVGNIVWQHGQTGVPGAEPWRLNGPHNADRLVNGNTIIADSNNQRIVEVTPAGSIVWSYAVDLNWPRDADRLDDGNTLINDSSNHRVIEVTPGGSIAWEYPVVGLSYDSDRLDNGNTLIGAGGRIIEVDSDGGVVWSYPPTIVEPIHVNIVMHNEEPPGYVDFVNDESAFWLHRAALVEFADMLHDNGVMFNWQSDWNFLMAAGMYDAGTPETNGKNIARYLKEELGFEVDPHAHETQYNYADVAYLIEALGVTPSQTNGGFRASPPEDSKLEYLWEPIIGWVYPDYTWQAQILWGGATLYHIDEESLWASGVWKPRDNHHFLEHDDDAPLPYVGGFGRGWDKLDQLLQMQQNGELETGRIHTTTIFVGQTELLAPGFIQNFETQIQTYGTAGDIRWVGLAEVIDIWHAEYDSIPNILPYLDGTDGNLLINADFEEGSGGQPTGWTSFSPDGALFTWDNTHSQSGDYSVKIEAPGAGIGLWLQAVNVSPGIVYTLAGQVSFENIVPPGHCNLRVVFRDAGQQIVEIVDLPMHDGTRPFEIDFPYNLKFRAPEGAVIAEINCLLEGPGAAWFDDLFFAPAPVGNIAGQVTCYGQPVPGARVWIWGDPWYRVCETFTNESGHYVLEDVPEAFPRYILMAGKESYKTRPAGDVDITADDVTIVDFVLEPGGDPDDLRVKFGSLAYNRFIPGATIPDGATIPPTAYGYPPEVRVHLEPDEYIQSDHPDVAALALAILESVPPEDRTDARAVAWAVYEWVCKNIDHDGVFSVAGAGGLNQPYKDVTSGIWQTISASSGGDGWCWGRNFYDWSYLPHETINEKCVICAEHSRLVAALLRALNIPARKSVGSHEYYVQTSIDNGVWIHGSTTSGRTSYRENGVLGQGFEGSGPERRFSVLSRPILHEDWNCWNKGLWREKHPWPEMYAATPAGYEQALADLVYFAETGEAVPGSPPPPGSDCFQIDYADITINLFNMGDQRTLDVRFPLVTDIDEYTEHTDNFFWTNHPECVIGTWVEYIDNPPAIGTERWFHIEFDLRSLLSTPGDLDGDGDVDLADLAGLLAAYYTCVGDPDFDPRADIDNSGCVDLSDLAILLANYGT